jgi:hypothetical protein
MKANPLHRRPWPRAARPPLALASCTAPQSAPPRGRAAGAQGACRAQPPHWIGTMRLSPGEWRWSAPLPAPPPAMASRAGAPLVLHCARGAVAIFLPGSTGAGNAGAALMAISTSAATRNLTAEGAGGGTSSRWARAIRCWMPWPSAGGACRGSGGPARAGAARRSRHQPRGGGLPQAGLRHTGDSPADPSCAIGWGKPAPQCRRPSPALAQRNKPSFSGDLPPVTGGARRNTDSKKLQFKSCCATRKDHTSFKASAVERPRPRRERLAPTGAKPRAPLGSTARKEVIRCLMVQHRGRLPHRGALSLSFEVKR